MDEPRKPGRRLLWMVRLLNVFGLFKFDRLPGGSETIMQDATDEFRDATRLSLAAVLLAGVGTAAAYGLSNSLAVGIGFANTVGLAVVLWHINTSAYFVLGPAGGLLLQQTVKLEDEIERLNRKLDTLQNTNDRLVAMVEVVYEQRNGSS